MSEEEKKAMEELKKFAYEDDWVSVWGAKTILNLIEKQDKMIDLMANEIYRLFYIVSKNVGYYQADDYSDGEDTTIEEIKEYFRKEVENEK